VIAEATVIGPTFVRASNSIAYLYNTAGYTNGPGLYGTVMYYMGENSSNAANKNDGDGAGLRVGYETGPANIALALSRTRYLAGDQSQNNIYASWKFPVATLYGLYEWDKNEALVGGSKAKGYSIGADVPVGTNRIWLLHSRYRVNRVAADVNHPTSKKYAVAYVHNLSKRTALYASYAHLANSGGAARAVNGATTGANSSSRGYDFGMRHSF
jgi:predicted porin